MKDPLWKTYIPNSLAATGARVRAFSLAPLRFRRLSASKTNGSRPIFIVGCGRSGNTLLRSIICAGGEVIIPPESYVLPRVIRLFHAYSWAPWSQICSIVLSEFEASNEFYMWEINLEKVHEKARELPKKRRNLATLVALVFQEYAYLKNPAYKRWGDKTPLNALYLGPIYRLYPRAQFVHIVRDPRAVAASYLRSGLGSTVESISKRWVRGEKLIRKYRRRYPNQFFSMRYEELVKRPSEVIESICKFLEIDYVSSMLNPQDQFANFLDLSEHGHHHRLAKPIDDAAIDAWRSELDASQLEQIGKVTEKLWDFSE